METLSKLFSSGTLVKVMRLFFFNPEGQYDDEDIAKATKSRIKDVRHETKLLRDINFLKPRALSKSVTTGRGKKAKTRRKKVQGWRLNPNFKYLAPLRALVVNTDLMQKGDIVKRLAKVGAVKLITVAGVFVQDPAQRVDILIVGDKIRQASLLSAIKAMEGLIGAEVRYVVLPSDEFQYRVSVRDRLVRDIFEYPHAVVLNTYKDFSTRELTAGSG